MAFNIEGMKSVFRTPARGTLFNVSINGANVQAIDGELLEFTCSAAQLPGDNISKIEVPFYGRKIAFPGDRQHEDWQTTIMAEAGYTLYKQLFEWKQAWNHSEENVATSADANDYKCDGFVTAYDPTGKATIRMKIVGLCPYLVTPIDMNWNNVDQLVEIQVTWSYDYVEMVD